VLGKHLGISKGTQEGGYEPEVAVELIGLARGHAGLDTVNISVQDGATWRDVIAALAQASPALVGTVLTEDRCNLIGSYVLNVSGRHSVYDLEEEVTLKAGYCLSVLDVGIC